MEFNGLLYLTLNEADTFDMNYRYVVPLPEFKHGQKKGHSVTTFLNYDSFSKSVCIDIKLLMSLITELISVKHSRNKDDGNYIFGEHVSIPDLKTAIYSIISEFLLCSNCYRPEIVLTPKSKKEFCKVCSGCGNIECKDNKKIINYLNENNSFLNFTKKNKKQK